MITSKEDFFGSLSEYAKQNSPYEPPYRPLNQLIFDGKLSMNQLKLFVKAKYCLEYTVPQVFAAGISRCNDPEWRKILSRVLAEETGVGGKAHDELWADVGVVLGISREELTPVRAVKDLWPTDRPLVEARINGILHSKSFETAICYMMGVAMVSPGLSKFFPMLKEAFRKHYGVKVDDLEYFNEEETADYTRGKLAKKLVLDYAERNNAYDQVRSAIHETIDLTKEMHTKREAYILSQT